MKAYWGSNFSRNFRLYVLKKTANGRLSAIRHYNKNRQTGVNITPKNIQ